MVRLPKGGHILFCTPWKMWGWGGKRSPREEQQAQECYKPASLCQANIKPELQHLSLSASQQSVDLICLHTGGDLSCLKAFPLPVPLKLPYLQQSRWGQVERAEPAGTNLGALVKVDEAVCHFSSTSYSQSSHLYRDELEGQARSGPLPHQCWLCQLILQKVFLRYLSHHCWILINCITMLSVALLPPWSGISSAGKTGARPLTMQKDHLSLRPVAQVHTRSHRNAAELQSGLGCGLVFGHLGGREGLACFVGWWHGTHISECPVLRHVTIYPCELSAALKDVCW